jgi:hypothetical protein
MPRARFTSVAGCHVWDESVNFVALVAWVRCLSVRWIFGIHLSIWRAAKFWGTIPRQDVVVAAGGGCDSIGETLAEHDFPRVSMQRMWWK